MKAFCRFHYSLKSVSAGGGGREILEPVDAGGPLYSTKNNVVKI